MSAKASYEQLLAAFPALTSEQKMKTSVRAAQAFEFLTQGYQMDLHAIAANSLYPCAHSDLVFVRDIAFISLCEHHLLPMLGTCRVVYKPAGKVLGLAKISEIVAMFSHRLQLQEKLTYELATAFMEVLKAEGVAVMLEAQHLCMVLHGVEKAQQNVVTTSCLGSLQKASLDLFRGI